MSKTQNSLNLIGSNSKSRMLLGLYTTQFLPLSFVFAALPAIMRKSGADLSQLSLIYAFGLIWVIKVFWAPLIDRFGNERFGHYRGWILSLQIVMIALLVLGSFFPVPEQTTEFFWVLGILCISSATLDIATDGLAVRMLEPEERGNGNAFQAAGGMLGNVIGGGVILIFYEDLGWQISMLLLAAMISLPIVNLLLFDEQASYSSEDNSDNQENSQGISLASFASLFKQDQIILWALLMACFQCAISIPYALLSPILVDHGWSLAQIGISINLVGSGFGALGAFIAGWIVTQFGRRSALIFASLSAVLAALSLMTLTQNKDAQVLAYCGAVCIMFSYGVGMTSLYTIMMDRSNPMVAGTHFSIQYAYISLVNFASAAFTLGIAEGYGYVSGLAIGLALSLMNIALAVLFFAKQKSKLELAETTA